MDASLVQVIKNSQQIIKSCQEQLQDLQKDPVNNAKLIQSLQQTYQQANQTLVAAQAASAQQVTRPTKSNSKQESHRMTRAEYRRLHEKGEI